MNPLEHTLRSRKGQTIEMVCLKTRIYPTKSISSLYKRQLDPNPKLKRNVSSRGEMPESAKSITKEDLRILFNQMISTCPLYMFGVAPWKYFGLIADS